MSFSKRSNYTIIINLGYLLSYHLKWYGVYISKLSFGIPSHQHNKGWDVISLPGTRASSTSWPRNHQIYKMDTPWKIKVEPTAITHEKKGKWSEPNLHEDVFYVNLQEIDRY